MVFVAWLLSDGSSEMEKFSITPERRGSVFIWAGSIATRLELVEEMYEMERAAVGTG